MLDYSELYKASVKEKDHLLSLLTKEQRVSLRTDPVWAELGHELIAADIKLREEYERQNIRKVTPFVIKS